MEFVEDDYVVGVWFAGGETSDWLATLVSRDGQLVGEYRHRYYIDDKTFDSDDKKSFYSLAPIEDTPENRNHLIDGLTHAQNLASKFGLTARNRFYGGTTKELLEWMKNQPGFHIMAAPKPEESN